MDSFTMDKTPMDFFNSEFTYEESMLNSLNFGDAATDNLQFNALNISQIPDLYNSHPHSHSHQQQHPQTIAPSALVSSPKPVYRPAVSAAHRLSPPEDSFFNIPRESSSSPSSSDAFIPIHSHHQQQHQQQQASMMAPAMAIPTNYLSGHSSSLSSAEGSPTVVGRGLRESPRVRGNPDVKPSPKRNGGSLVHRHQRSSSNAAAPATTTGRPARRGSNRRMKEEEDWTEFDEDDDFAPHGHSSALAGVDAKPERRRDDIRKQRIESEQRRRDELREGYNRLKSALPPSNQKSSKASILERATVCITELNHKTISLGARVDELEQELRRVRVLNETLMLSAAEHRSAAAAAQYAVAQAGVHFQNA